MGTNKKHKRDEARRRAHADARRTPAQVAKAKRLARECGDCHACCTTLGVPTLGKKANIRCEHLCAGKCGIYATRPSECAGYLCLWRQGWGTGEQRPDRLGAIVDLDVQSPETVAAFGGRGVSVTTHDRSKMGGGVFRVHVTDETCAPSDAIRHVVHEFVAAGEVVVLVHDGRARAYGPAVPDGRDVEVES